MLLCEPRVLIADEPTRGVDVGAKRAIYDMLVSLAERGNGDAADLVGARGDPRARAPRRSSCAAGGPSPSSPASAMTEAAILAAAFSEPVSAERRRMTRRVNDEPARRARATQRHGSAGHSDDASRPRRTLER